MSCTRLVPPAALALVACAACCVAAEPAAPAKPTKEQIAKWVQQLGSDDFGTREEASKKLYEAGQAAEAALQEALKSDDAEVVRRAGEVLEKFKWGLYPDAPQKVVDLVHRYQAADLAGRQAVIKELLEAGPAGYRTLLKIAGAEPDQNVRRSVFVQIAKELGRAAPQMVVEENYDTLELLLEITLTEDVKQGVGHYAAYWMMRGKLDDRIAHYKALAKGPDAKQASLVLAHLYRAKGDLAAARDAAEKADDPALVDALLYEAGDWKELARRPVATESGQEYEKIGHRAAYHRLSGDTKAFEDDLAELRKLVDAAPPGDSVLHFYFAKVLFLNDRPADAVDVLVKGPGNHAIAFEILAAQMKYRAALELADKDDSADGHQTAVLAILKARTLYSLGEKDKALAIFAKYGDQIKEGAEFAWFQNLIEAENRVGLKAQADEHAGRLLAISQDQGWSPRLFGTLYASRSETAEGLWQVLRRKPGEAPAATMKRLRDLMEGKAAAKDLADLVAGEDDVEAKGAPRPDDVDRWRRALADAAVAAKQDATAQTCLEKAGTAAALLRLGDLYADKKEWEKAADRYQQAWDKDHGQPLALYLSGWALAKAGKDKEAQKRMDQSHWTPLGDEVLRFGFLRALAERGQKDAARREGELLLRFSQPGSFYAGEGMRRLALADMDHKEYLKAADGQERSMLRCLRTYINYLQPTAYVGVPALLHRLRADGDAAAGKLDDAEREIAAGLADLPGDVNIPIRLIPELEKAGRKKEAGRLFDQCLAVQEQLCKDYPDCAWCHNSVAWLSACCRRNLDKALDHALKAVELSPASSGYQDTLAEVYFQRGDKDKAIAAQKKAIELEPKKAYFRKQLKRIEAGDPAVERPAEDEGDDD